MIGTTAALIGAGAGLGGSLLQANAQKKAAKTAAEAARFKPYDTSNLFGTADWQNGNLNQSLSPWAAALSGQLQTGASDALNNPFSGYGSYLQDYGLGGVQGAYDDANSYGGLDPGFLSQINSGFGQLAGLSPQQVSGYAPNSGGVDLSNLFLNAGQGEFAREQMQMGRNLMGRNYNQVASDQLGLMRKQAQPYESQQTDALFQRLFNQGRMGSTGGGNDIAAFARGLGEADVSRQLSANQFADSLYQNDQNRGANLFSGGAGLFQSGQSLAGQIGSNINSQNLSRDQFQGNLGLQAALANQGAGINAAQIKQAALTGLGGFGIDASNLGYSRANDRLARATQLFGFGDSLGTSNLDNVSQYMQLLSGITGQQNELAQIGLQAGGASAQAGANAGRFTTAAAGSPIGGFFQGLGGGILNAGMNNGAFDGLFGGGGAPAATGWYNGNSFADLNGPSALPYDGMTNGSWGGG